MQAVKLFPVGDRELMVSAVSSPCAAGSSLPCLRPVPAAAPPGPGQSAISQTSWQTIHGIKCNLTCFSDFHPSVATYSAFIWDNYKEVGTSSHSSSELVIAMQWHHPTHRTWKLSWLILDNFVSQCFITLEWSSLFHHRVLCSARTCWDSPGSPQRGVWGASRLSNRLEEVRPVLANLTDLCHLQNKINQRDSRDTICNTD